jgi:hypothetical protein
MEETQTPDGEAPQEVTCSGGVTLPLPTGRTS